MQSAEITCKNLFVKVIPERVASAFICEHHYSGKCAVNPQVNFGVYLNNRLEGAIQLGPSLDKRKIIGLVRDTRWNEFIELNRLAFSDELPKNSESRALSVVFRMFRKEWPHLKWIVSFADATQCGDGTIYRASGFLLTGIKKNDGIYRLPDGRVFHKLIIQKTQTSKLRTELRRGLEHENTSSVIKESGAERLCGFQLRYIYFVKPELKNQLTVPIIPFDKIAEVGATMYKGNRAREA